MRYAIISSKNTGNTNLLTEKVRDVLKGFSESTCTFSGCVQEMTEDALTADRIYVGFWTDKGMCDEVSGHLLSSLKNKEIFLFGSAGFGVDQAYFDQVLDKTKELIDPSNKVIGTFMCQGKMKQIVRDKYTEMLKGAKAAGDEKTVKTAEMLIKNFDMALSHPDLNDFENLADTVIKKFY